MTDFFNNSKLESFVDDRIDKKMKQFNKEKEPKKLFTRKELKAYLRTTYPTIDRWCKAELLTKIHIGSRVYFDSVEVYALLESKDL